ncbi:T-cell-specific guanine nucleotide triphosphate-binding protein 2-like [Mytilus edulis]|uniref:T-cell-specific guanine nucleotide triphosphate-binding protein 2-like n=1 Tax=Mytilus edulis TaxID=6550 RepID=UPI0039F09E53
MSMSRLTSELTLPISQVSLPTSQVSLPTSQFLLPTSRFLLPTSNVSLPLVINPLSTSQFSLPTSHVALVIIPRPASQFAFPTSHVPLVIIPLPTSQFSLPNSHVPLVIIPLITKPLETTELDVGENRTEEISQAQSAITEPLETTELDVGENRTEGISQAQSAITESDSLTEIKELVTRIKEEGSEKFMKQLNKTLDKWKNEKVNFGLAGSSAMGKSSFMNVLIGRTGDIDERAKTSAHGNTTTSPTEYAYARQKNVSFTDFPGYGTPFFKSQAYLKKTSIDKCDYVLIFFHVVSTIDTWFAKTLDERKTKFCFVRTKLDYDIESAKYDNQEDTDPECIANSLRQTAVEAIEKEGLENPTVFVISNRRNDIGHFSDLLSHIEKVLHRTKYEAFIFEISTYTRDVIKRKHLFLCQRINGVTMRAQIEEGNEATEFNSSIAENPQKGIFQTVRYLERELMLYLDTFELNKNKSIELISQESVKQKLKFESLLLHSRFENYIKGFIVGELEILVAEKSSTSPEKAADDDEELFREYPFLLPSRKLLSEVLDGLQEDALVIFEEFQKQ